MKSGVSGKTGLLFGGERLVLIGVVALSVGCGGGSGDSTQSADAGVSVDTSEAPDDTNTPIDAPVGDQTAPTVERVEVDVLGTTVRMSGSAYDANGDLETVRLEIVSDASFEEVEVTPDGVGAWTHEARMASPGEYTVRALAIDATGLDSGFSEPARYTVEPDRCAMADEHLDLAQLEGALGWIDENAPAIDSFLVSHCGRTVMESYYNGYDRDTLHELQSATKTFSAVLIGIAIDQGVIADVDQPLIELLPNHADLFEGDKANITLRHALTMTTGLAWTDFGLINSFDRIVAAEDSVAFVLGEELVTPPGETFFYNTGSSHLLAAIIHTNTGMTVAEFAEEHLFGPLQITEYTWPTLRDGIHQGGWGLYMRPADFLKFGEMLVNRGVWDGERIVSAEFVDAATAAQVPSSTGGGYGYQMWIDTNVFQVSDIAGARGYGGQDCFVLEKQGMVAVFTGNIQFPVEMARDVTTVMNRFVLPAYIDPER